MQGQKLENKRKFVQDASKQSRYLSKTFLEDEWWHLRKYSVKLTTRNWLNEEHTSSS